jgi:hypothetical protein
MHGTETQQPYGRLFIVAIAFLLQHIKDDNIHCDRKSISEGIPRRIPFGLSGRATA